MSHAPAAISGRVLTADSQTPIGGAVVRATEPGGKSLAVAVTNDEGYFRLLVGAPARALLTASKVPYLPMSFGADRPDRNGVPIDLSPGTGIGDIAILLPLGAVLSGRVIDPSGSPLPGARVAALSHGETVHSPEAVTDDLGEFRIYGLPPGRYFLAAVSDRAVKDGVPGVTEGRAVVFWPGAPSAQAAEPIEVGVAEERRGLVLLMKPVPFAEVRGTISHHAARSLRHLTVGVIRSAPRLPLGWQTEIAPRFDGDRTHFVFQAVPPGDYRIFARLPAESDQPELFGSVSVVTRAAGTIGINIELKPLPAIGGSFHVETERALSQPLELVLLPDVVTAYTLTGFPMQRPVTIKFGPDGRFVSPAVAPGAYRLQLREGGRLLSLKSLIVDGLESETIEATGDRPAVVVQAAFTDRPAGISGFLERIDGGPPSDFDIVIVGVGQIRGLSTRPDAAGQFSFFDLRPGRYVLAAVTDARPSDLADSRFLATLRREGMMVTVAPSEITEVRLRAGGR